MRRLAALTLATLTACTGGGGSSGPAVVPEAPPTPVATPAVSVESPPEVSVVPTPRSTATLAGTVSYLARIALTPEAVVQVELRDVSVPDSDAPVVGKQVIRRPGQVPISFALEYEPSAIQPGHVYAVSARIVDRGQLQFVTDNPVSVVPRGMQAGFEILVVPVR